MAISIGTSEPSLLPGRTTGRLTQDGSNITVPADKTRMGFLLTQSSRRIFVCGRPHPRCAPVFPRKDARRTFLGSFRVRIFVQSALLPCLPQITQPKTLAETA